jgi:hypothetical protein
MLKYIFLIIAPISFGAVIDGEIIATLVEGDAKMYINQSASDFSKGSVIKSGSNLKTGDKSKAELFVSNGIRLVMLPNSSLNVKTLKQEEGSIIKPNPENKSVKESSASITDFEVEGGKVIGDVKKLAPMSVFTMKTPVGVVKIKGTVFSVEYKINKDGTALFNVGCLVGRVVVQMADERIPPVSVPAGQQMSVSAPLPPPSKPNGEKPEQNEGPKKNSGENKEEKPAPPPPPMKIEVRALPPVEMKEMSVRMDMPPPPTMPPPPPPPQDKASSLDRIIQNVEYEVRKEQVDPTPSGG